MHHKMNVVSKFAVATAMVTILAFSASAKGKDANVQRPNLTTTLNVMDPLTVGGQTLKPGTYTVKATDSNVSFVQDGKTVAQVNVEWKDATNKSQNSNLLADAGSVKEIHFGGQTRYVVIE
jgi:hypothetical protein